MTDPKLPWFRMYGEAIDDEKLRLLAFEDRWHFVALLCCKTKGILDETGDLMRRKVAVKLGLAARELDEVARRLAEVELIDFETLQPIGWEKRQYTTLQMQQWRHRDKRQGAGLPRNRWVNPKVRAAVMERDNHTCRHCGSTENLTIDHIKPEMHGGTNEPDNLQVLCRACNARKRDFPDPIINSSGTHKAPISIDTDTDTDTETESITPPPVEIPAKARKRVSTDKPVDVSEEVWQSFKLVRNKKKAAITDLAILGIRREAVKAGIDLEQALTICCERGWASFKADWDWRGGSKPSAGRPNANAALFASMTHLHQQQQPEEHHGRTIDVTPRLG